MKQNDFEAYKKAIKQHYEKEKNGYYSSYLLQPSRANLRKLCVERLKENATNDDLNTFRIHMGFDFIPEHKNRLKEETDRFRAIENFLKGSTDSNDLDTINLTAILVDFSPRPFLKFVRAINGEKDTPTVVDVKKEESKTVATTDLFTEKGINSKKKWMAGLIGFTALFSIGYTAKDIVLPEKQCMQWQKDHYEVLECDSEVNALYTANSIEPINEKLLDFKKIEVNNHTPFFEKGKAIVWYCKISDTEIDCFNGSGDGYHPVLDKSLRPITKYIIDKYVPK
ncbi:hypothetical protein IVB69_11775 [Flavobacterium sp. J49]|uniref:hypothetical protein n=1 Tax=Flavobacterium sp. J49 TaxID=2718534 RepID=UPI0015940792|nr:hypothetical protein [Flavobacterium sp. J49]MBF6642162.1 hypothetical protein [Flavobacterium sp. J49]NIC03409.1 hypothetical protein [Flavobacterium sp. J49]